MKWLDDLNSEQRSAVETTDGPVLIIAGPGTGKTKTLAARIAYLIARGHAKPQEITALTFTNKAAREMQERAANLLGAETQLPRIATFHALGHEILSAHTNKPLQFVGDEDRLELIRGLSKSLKLKGLSARELASRISHFKTSISGGQDDIAAKLVMAYDAALAERDLHDFDDLLSKTHALLSANEALREQAAAHCRYLLIDEFQDTNELQYELMCSLMDSENIFVIGDPLQSIYAFRGASGDVFERFKADFPKHRDIVLSINYRSAPEIVRVSNAIFMAAPALTAHEKMNGQAKAVQVLNEYSEADWILNEIEQHLGGTDMLKGHQADSVREQARQFSDYAVLYRTHRTAKVLEQKLAESGIPYQVAGDDSPYEQSIIKTILRALRFLDGGELPVIKGLSESQIKTLLKDMDASQPLSKIVHQLIEKLGLDQGDDMVHRTLSQFMSTLTRFDDATITDYLEHVDEIAGQGFYDPQAEAITLLTIHAAKGLEFTHVFLIGAEEGLLPYERKGKMTDTEEERRLFYVAVTRAKKQLDILHAKFRGSKPAKVSRFVESLPAKILPRITDPGMGDQQKRLAKKRLKRAQQSLF